MVACGYASLPTRATADPPPAQAAAPAPPPLLSRAERSDFVETSRAADIDEFLRELRGRTDLLRTRIVGASEEGRPLLLATLSNPPVSEAREIRALGRPVVLVQANIHGGEVEGKEAAQHLMRRLTVGDLRPLLDRLVVLVIPNYNADGNEAIDVMNRTAQNGPLGGVGRRENARGLDLNRDFMKLDSAEARALVGVLNEFDPHVVVDLHTTNGSYHGYHLTYSIPVNLSLEPALLSYERDTMMPALQRSMLERHAFRSYYYGNFEGKPPANGQPDTRSWVAFDHRPRIGQNYVGLRNRIAILSEAYSYLDFRERVAVTEAFVADILGYASEHAGEIMALTGSLDRSFVERARRAGESLPLGVEYAPKALPNRVPILVGTVTTKISPRSGKEMRVAVPDAATPVEMSDYGYFEPTRSVPMARGYLLPDTDVGRSLADHLLRHGIAVERLTKAWTGDVTSFRVRRAIRSSRPFQGRTEITVEGEDVTAPSTLPAGTYLIRLAQPLGRLAAYLLEPESDDGVVHWNMLGSEPREGDLLPMLRTLAAGEWASEPFSAAPSTGQRPAPTKGE